MNATLDDRVTTAPPRRHAAPPRVRERAGRRGGTLAAGVLLGAAVVLALLVAGMLAPHVPVLGLAGVTASAYLAWALLGAAVVTVLAAILLMRRGGVVRVAATTLGLAALAGSVVVGWQQLSVAREHRVAVDVGGLFALTGSRAEPDASAAYGEHEGRPLGLSLWEPAGSGAGAAPVVVLLHGGGWTSQDRLERTTTAHATWFAEQGYLAISVDYPLSDDEHHLWEVAEPQVACALSWVQDNAARHGGDPGRVFLVGASAGGNLALDVAYRAAAGDLDPACGSAPPVVAAVSTLYPVASPAAFAAGADPLLGGAARDTAIAYTGGTPEGVPERYAAVTPAEHVTDAAPPTLVVAGAADHLVPPAGAVDLAATLEDAGVSHELVVLPAAGHRFDAAPGGVGTQVWRELTLRWFDLHGRAPTTP
ncbi:alpha/beta hydrolase [Isoptericola variabilis]|uniref:alpha/beta hydrolase n=1 Tax=Isoptericola variabilis TaxID=139208 RepID=UPI00030CB356|nr:alpha/beta hydrolase [Isoptericola variabilis]